ncbi:hypothetical protein [Nocardia thailandica]|uniref:hypothetical protein n=1 Tax=Nocardia thailandica TaxID=257275 RepID=UPI0002D43BAA|nr:hypothetical protein [Nocardia thailandica]
MRAENIAWGRERDGDPTEAELVFATSLDALFPGLEYWLHADDDGTPWLLVSLDIVEENAIRGTLRLDFDDHGIRGGWSPANLNWDGGVRAEEGVIDPAEPDSLTFSTAGSSVEYLARRAAEWFGMPKNRRWDGHSGS